MLFCFINTRVYIYIYIHYIYVYYIYLYYKNYILYIYIYIKQIFYINIKKWLGENIYESSNQTLPLKLLKLLVLFFFKKSTLFGEYRMLPKFSRLGTGSVENYVDELIQFF